MVSINSVIINDDLFTSEFCCNLDECKGICCCLQGGRGAPLRETEIPILKEVLEKIKYLLSKESIDVINSIGFYEGSDGDFYITCINDQDCIFVYYDHNIAKCSIEKAYNEGEIDWRKPISCHLYPIRINKFGGDVLRYSKISECQSAVRNGKKNNVPILEFLKDPLIRNYGENWYNELKTYFDPKQKTKQ